MNKNLSAFTKGIHNTLAKEIIPRDAQSSSLGWTVNNGQLELMRGRIRVGADGGVGEAPHLHVGYKANGTSQIFRKITTKIQYLNGTTWTDIITGLTDGAPVKFSNYQSLAGAFTYIFSTDGIYKICNANPGSYTSLYDSAANFNGLGFIDQGRTILWGREKDPSGLYGSWIDNQLGVSGSTGVYTTVTAEAVAAVESGTLAFKAGGATRTCFGVTITDTSSGEVFTDDFNGVLTGTLGSTGTINYTTGAFTISGQTGAGTVDYQWENSNLRGVTDFRKSATRLAGEGFIFRQDYAGDAIKTVIPLEGTYYSIKTKSIYALTIAAVDTTATNEIFRINVGITSRDAATATSKGIILLDTADGEKPIMRIISRNPLGDNFDMTDVFKEFDFSDYNYSTAVLFTYGDYVLVACKTLTADANDTVLMCDFIDKTVMVAPYEVRSFAQDGSVLYSGDSVSANVYETFNGFDDLGYAIENYTIGRHDTLDIDYLKKTKKMRFKGLISAGQIIKVYLSLDDGSFELIGTINGDANYVDVTKPNTIGSSMIGANVVGGGSTILAYPFYTEMKIRTTKYLRRSVKFVAINIGYAAIQSLSDVDIWQYEDKMPKKYRLKQNVDINDSTDINN